MIDTIRHMLLFSPERFAQMIRRIDVIGAGATGSRIVRQLGKLGVTGVCEVHVWDDDVVKGHNVGNQDFGNHQKGMFKVEALAQTVLLETGTRIVIHNERVNGTQNLGQIVFVLTDTMQSREEIWEKGLKLKLRTNLVIETRMGKDCGRIYTINPGAMKHIAEYEKTLNHNVAETSACGSPISVGPTAEILSGYALWQMMKWFMVQEGKEEIYVDNEVIFSLCPLNIMSRTF